MFESTLALLESYLQPLSERPPDGFDPDLGGELRERIQQLEYSLARIRQIEESREQRSVRQAEREKAATDKLVAAVTEKERDEAAASMGFLDSFLVERSLLVEMKFFAEAFYYFAFRAVKILQNGSAPFPGIKNLSVNNVYLRWHVPEADDGSGEHGQRQIGAMHLLVSNQQLAKAREPRVRNLDHPAPRALALGALLAFFATRAHMWGVVAIEHLLLGDCANEAGVGAQVLAGTRRHRRSRLQRGRPGWRTNWLTSCRLAAVTMIDSGTPRASTSNIRLLPFFSPVRGVGPHRLLCQRRLQ